MLRLCEIDDWVDCWYFVYNDYANASGVSLNESLSTDASSEFPFMLTDFVQSRQIADNCVISTPLFFRAVRRGWQMLLNFGKCKCIHIGHGNMDKEYKMGDAVLGRTTQEKDLGVTFSADMKVSEQCGIAASK